LESTLVWYKPMSAAANNLQEVMMEFKINREGALWREDGDSEEVTVMVSMTVTAKKGEKGVTTGLKREIAKSVSELNRHLTQGKRWARGESQIGVVTTQPEDRPYRLPDFVYGDVVPDFDWTPGGKVTKTELDAAASKPEPDGVD